MKHPLVQLLAVAIGILVIIVAFRFASLKRGPSNAFKTIGEIQSVTGQVERRLPNTVSVEGLPGPRPLYNQDLIITQKSSTAVLYLNDAQITLRLNESSRFIAELDASKPGALIGTLLSGTVSVLVGGKPGAFRLFKEGRLVGLNDLDKIKVPLIQSQASARPSGSPQPEETPAGLVITATKADDSPIATPTPHVEAAQAAAPSEQGNDVLTNDDILRQLRNQSGFLQRCYLNYLHRNQSKNGKPEAIGAGGVVTVSFVVQSNGRVNEARVVKSDFKDSTLHNCVTEVIERTVYRGFRGNPVPVLEFPITLQ